MKRIIEVCSKNAPKGTANDVVKLRLRGKGSGFKEGPRQEESKEPLHLCISSRFADKYKLACEMAHELLLTVYEDYKRYADKHHRTVRQMPATDAQALISPTTGTLLVKKSEVVTGGGGGGSKAPPTTTNSKGFNFESPVFMPPNFKTNAEPFTPTQQMKQ